MNDHDELESFRREWRNEVTNRKRTIRRLSAGDLARGVTLAADGNERQETGLPASASSNHEQTINYERHGFGTTHDYYNEVEDRETGKEGFLTKQDTKELLSALDHYEKAVERENMGNLGDSVTLYRTAYRLDADVHEAYQRKHFPSSSYSKLATPAEATSPIVQGRNSTEAKFSHTGPIGDLIDSFANLSIPAAPPAVDLSPNLLCPLADLPEEILSDILRALALQDITSFVRIAQVCKHLAYLVSTEDRIWKLIVLGEDVGFAGMHYDYACDLNWKPLHGPKNLHIPSKLDSRPYIDLTPSVYPDHRSQFRHRPRIRFNGCYISTVNYTRPGASHQSQYTWSSPIHIVTYYRYLRFFRDGTAISLLTTSEPNEVVYHMTKENMHSYQSQNFPSAVMANALKGRWRLTGPSLTSVNDQDPSRSGPGDYKRESHDETTVEGEGGLHVETQGVTPKYIWKMQFALGSAGRKDGTRNNKLNWKGFWSYNKLTDDWGEFGLKNDKAFYFSRVRSYGKIS